MGEWKCAYNISIHAPRTGSDHHWERVGMGADHFNPRSPHGERQDFGAFISMVLTFQSTLPARGATMTDPDGESYETFQSTLPARGATTRRTLTPIITSNFNPRSPHGERLYGYLGTIPVYISIHAPRTGSDICQLLADYDRPTISIHAPRTGSDLMALLQRRRLTYFNPRSPHGERRSERRPVHDSQAISIHAPRTGSDD